jgi:iron complex transport system permease protein
MLRRISLWQMGNLQGASWDRVGLCTVTSGFLGLLIPREAGALNAMLLGESEARHLGVNVEWLKRRLIIYSALGVAISVAVAGVIAFVGLMVPHLIRLLVGPNHRALLPLSALAGAILLVAADALARVVIAPAELPVGVVTALLGAPFFLWLLVVQRRRTQC